MSATRLRIESLPTLVAAALLFASPAASASAQNLKILRIDPSGVDVPVGRQIVFQFDRPVVPVGRMERSATEIPIVITPAPGCEWRWLNTSALACQLGDETALIPATRYRVVVRPGLVAETGERMDEEIVHEFLTRRPQLRHYWFDTWRSPGTPRIRVTFDQPVDGDSVAEHLFFGAGDQRLPLRAEPVGEYGSSWTVTPVVELPLDTELALRVEPGVRSERGIEPGAEDRQVVVFKTFPEHRFLGVRCRDNQGISQFLGVGSPPDTRRLCDPLARVELVFSSPVVKEVLREHLAVTPDLAGGRDDYDPWDNVYSYSRLDRAPTEHRYGSRLPEVLRAATDYRLVADAEALLDEFGRPLGAAIDFQFKTDHRRPRFVLDHRLSTLEQAVDSHLPVVVTNLDKVEASFDRFGAAGLETGLRRELEVPEAPDVAFRYPLPVRDWLDGGSGVIVGKLTAEPWDDDHWFFTQVTPFGIHAKSGFHNTLVWVTDLVTGEPVAGARVEMLKKQIYDLEGDDQPLAEAVTDDQGLAVLPGAAHVDPERRLIARWMPRDGLHLMLRVTREGDHGLVPLREDYWARARGPNRVYVPEENRPKESNLTAWGLTPQGIYRAGDEVDYKIYVRREGNRRLEPAPPGLYELTVEDPQDRVVHERKEIELNDFGGFEGRFLAPKTGAVGWYRFILRASFAGDEEWRPLEVLVSDFTPAPFRVSTELGSAFYRDGDEVVVASRASLHSGGPYMEAATRVTATLKPAPFRPSDPLLQGFWFRAGSDYRTRTVHRREAEIDAKGELETRFNLSTSAIYGRLEVETAVRDDRGKYVAATTSAPFAGRDRFVGIRQPGWLLHAGEEAFVEAVVVDEHGETIADATLTITIEHRKTTAARVKGAGNAYLTQYTHVWEPASSCELVSAEAAVGCSFAPQKPGSYQLTATTLDGRGRTVRSRMWRWAVGKGQVLWEEPPGDHLQIEPEKETLRVGETARYLIKNPFPGARALVTIERAGVIDKWVQVLEESSYVLEFEVKPDYIPGFYLSVVVMSPRVAPPPEDDRVDLGKPSFRIGYVRVPVRDPYKELEVEVRPSGEVFKPRDTVTVEIEVEDRQGGRPRTEFAVAVLDEAVFDLLAGGAKLFDPYAGLYRLRPLDVLNHNLLKVLIGWQKFEQKGADAGGGGGSDGALRSLFKFVSYWNPSLEADADGRATVEFEVPDNLTGWRVLVVAVTPEDYFGLGQASFKVNRPTEIRPALPNQVIEGDRFEARFTVMNRTESPRTLEITGRAEGVVNGEPKLATTLDAEPFRRYMVGFPVAAADPGEIHFEIAAGDESDRDRLATSMPVGRRKAIEAAATYGSTTAARVEETIEFPLGIRTDVGRVSVVAAPSVIGSLEGAFEYVRDYPYRCWEQRLTKGVMAAHYVELERYLDPDLDWDGAAQLAARMLADAANFQAPSGGMTYWIPRDKYVSPYLTAYTALAFGWLRELDYEIPAGVEARLHDYLERMLRTDVFPSFYSKGMASSVRAVALAALARAERVSLLDLGRYRAHAPQMDLFGKAHYLQALKLTPGAAEIRPEVERLILGHANESGGKIVFSESLDDGYARMLHSEMRTNCAILSALALRPDERRAAGISDLPFKMARSITQTRGRRHHWENTQENVFCTRALVEYSREFEAVEPGMTVSVDVGGRPIGEARLDDPRDPAVEFERPIGPDDPGTRTTVGLDREGDGRLYYSVRLFYSPATLRAARINSGIEVRREYSVERDGTWQRLADPAEVEQGELVRVDLFVDLPAARNFVVVDDPVPGGLEPVNRDLATASTVDDAKAKSVFPPDSYYYEHDDWRRYAYSRWSFYHRELRHDAVRFYSDWLPAGRYVLSYVAQVIAPGEFAILPLHVEEMYDPDVFGQGLPGTLRAEAPP